MKHLKILMMVPYLPNEKNVSTILANKILFSLRKKCVAELIWILSSTKKPTNHNFPNISIRRMQNYDNACQILDIEKPDVIIVTPSFSYTNYPLIIAGRHKKIPVITCELYGFSSIGLVLDRQNRFQIFISKIRRFFGKINDSPNSPSASKGKFYFYKYKFLYKTLKAVGYSKLQLIQNVLENIWINTIGVMDKNIFDRKLLTDKICLATIDSEKYYLQSGFPNEILHVTGSPLFDDYQIDNILTKNLSQDKFLQILIVTTPLSLHGLMSKHEQTSLIKNLLNILNQNQTRIKFALKIHPSSESIQDYEEILHSKNLSIPIFQKEPISEILQEYDIAISFGVYSSVILDILFSGTPLILLAVDKQIRNLLVLTNIALECKNVDEIMEKINFAKTNQPLKEPIENFLKNTSYPLDGHASDRISSIILSSIKN